MNSERWKVIKKVFADCADLPEATQQECLRKACGDDAILRAEVESLLAANRETESFLSRGAMGGLTRTIQTRPPASTEASRGGSGEDRFMPGTIFAGRYRIISLAGKGGMGEVYRAYDLQLKQTIALKLLPVASRDALERFRNEVRVARQVTHPNACRVFDIGETEGTAYLTMEYIDGEDLASLLLRIGRLPEDKALEIAQQICAGLHAAHDKGILHRDLKPANIMLDGRGQARLTDFGLAALAETVEGREARHGTPLYMAPEQLAGKEASTRSDIYALGLILFEMFTGRRPFEAQTGEQLRLLRASTPVPHPSNTIGNLKPSIERTILRCLEIDPSSRPATAPAVANSLAGKDTSGTPITNNPFSQGGNVLEQPGGLSRRMAGLLLAFTIIGMLLTSAWANSIGWLAQQQTRPEQPEVLAHQAQQLASAFGYPPPVDSAWAFVGVNPKTMASVRRMEFWYRQAPCIFEPDTITSGFIPPGRVGPENPKIACPGEINIFLTLDGRIVRLRGVPVAYAAAGKPDPDWSCTLRAAGFDPGNMRPIASSATPDASYDAQQAWTAADDQHSPIRIEAASWRSLPVYFAVGKDPYFSNSGSGSETIIFRAAVFLLLAIFLVCAGSIVLVRHNLKLGRGDRAGALRLAKFVFFLCLLIWALVATHRLTLNEATLFLAAIGWALTMAGSVWVVYMALEPYVRRRWPHSFTGIHQLLDGSIRNPLVGRDALIGMAAGVVVAVLYDMRLTLDQWLGSAPMSIPGSPVLNGFRQVLSFTLYDMNTSIWSAFLFLGVLFLLRLLLRRTWAAALAFVVLFSGTGIFASEHLAADLPLLMMAAGWMVFMLLRLGVLAAIIAECFGPMLWGLAFPFDLSKWYALPSACVFAMMIALTVYAYKLAVPNSSSIADEVLYS